MTGRPANIPTRGDISARLVAQLMGLSSADFQILRPQLEQRGFPGPDLTTGNYCIEAVWRWRAMSPQPSRYASIPNYPSPVPPAWIRALAVTCKKRAAKILVEFSLTHLDLHLLAERASGVCEISGIAFDTKLPEHGKRRPFAASLDRIDNSNGYTRGNVRLVCCIVNFAMNEWGEAPLRSLVDAMKKRGAA